jgi:hypothetical protein
MITSSSLRKLAALVIMVVWFFPGGAVARGNDRPGESVRVVTESSAPVPNPGGTPGTPADAKRFADREQQAAALAQFEAGARISTTTVIVILLLVIILLLLL